MALSPAQRTAIEEDIIEMLTYPEDRYVAKQAFLYGQYISDDHARDFIREVVTMWSNSASTPFDSNLECVLGYVPVAQRPSRRSNRACA